MEEWKNGWEYLAEVSRVVVLFSGYALASGVVRKALVVHRLVT